MCSGDVYKRQVYESNGTYVLRLTTSDGVAGFVLTDATPVYNNASSNVGPSGLGLGDSVTVYSSGASIARVVITKDIVIDPGNVNMPEFTNQIKDCLLYTSIWPDFWCLLFSEFRRYPGTKDF